MIAVYKAHVADDLEQTASPLTFLPLSGSTYFLTRPDTARSILLDKLLAAEDQRAHGVTEEPKEKNIECGTDGQNIATLSRMNISFSCKTYHQDSAPDSLELLLPPCEGDNFPG
jgi:hypothetical protein